MIDTMDQNPPGGSTILFDGTSLNGWTTTDGEAPGWTIVDGTLEVVPGAGDIRTKATFRDHFLHLEFMLSDMPEAKGQGKSNSGVFVQNRYELQVLDSTGWNVPGMGDCGAVYYQYAPLTNACKRPMTWQTYDIIFRAPRCEGSVVKERARMTVFLNGTVVQNNVELAGPTGMRPADTAVWTPGPLRLQDHKNVVWYRNIWASRLRAEGSDEYAPRNNAN